MGSSKKHKKHKEKDRERGEKHSSHHAAADDNPEQRPLKLVLKVGGGQSTTVGHSANVASPTPEVEEHPPEEAAPKLTLAFDHQTGEMISTSHGSSSGKKMKKKKSKKKHKKHSHHHHHSHHHRHRTSCSHHSKSHSHEGHSVPPPVATENIVPPPLPPPPVVDGSEPPAAATPAPVTTPFPTVSPAVTIVHRPKPKRLATKAQFHAFVYPLLKQLKRRDAQDFFAWPVTDLIAPGYSSIIQKPMDFSTIKKKLDMGLYDNIPDFKADVKLMCDNASK